MNEEKNKSGFDLSKIGIRISKETPEHKPTDNDPDVKTMMEERTKMKKEGTLALSHDREERLNSPDQKIEEFLDKNDIEKKEVGYFINRKLVKQIIDMHPFITSARQLSIKAKFPDKRYGQLNLKTKQWHRVDKQLIKNLASVLEIKDWRVLIDHEMTKEYEKNQKKAQKYLSDIEQLEKSIKEENPEQYEEHEYSLTSVVGK